MPSTAILLALLSLVLALPSPDSLRMAPGQCKTPGQFLCITTTSFAICDDSLTGQIQYLGLGDPRCDSLYVSPSPSPPAAPAKTATTPPPPPKTTSTPPSPPKATTTAAPPKTTTSATLDPKGKVTPKPSKTTTTKKPEDTNTCGFFNNQPCIGSHWRRLLLI
ncbi:hypothetical protein H2200_004958 [Cladophialophora chaetospira]|uniref:Uncharacterized protein n=1 Tax=Cladophialophora chaetospira TaxID=386627 RepID=A0AA38XER7_9EURO|nr:hypothetical protein H2200_004958 [Cladophialophora chaetospira]